MHVVITTIGTRGDVQPLLGLAKGLAARGHRVTMATHTDHEPFVREHGCEFRPIGGSFQELMESPEGRAWLESGDSLTRYLKTTRALFDPLLASWYADQARACEDADVVLSHPAAMGAFHAAEKHGKPVVAVPLYPVLASGEIAPMAFPRTPAWRWLRSFLSDQSSRSFSSFGRPYVAAHREAMGLPPRPKKDEWRDTLMESLVLHLYSPHLLPRPSDWADNAHVTGFCNLETATSYTPPRDLEEFLARGEAIYVGFGSMTGRDPEQLAKLTIEALRRAKQRAVIVTGWGGMKGAEEHDAVYVTREVPHDWLFSRVRAAVHHGGAGTTAASLRAGLPTLVVAFFGDQTMWGERVRVLGAGPPPLQRRKLSVESLASAVTRLLGDEAYRRGAATIAEKLRAEDGVAAAIARIEQHLRS